MLVSIPEDGSKVIGRIFDASTHHVSFYLFAEQALEIVVDHLFRRIGLLVMWYKLELFHLALVVPGEINQEYITGSVLPMIGFKK